MSIKTQYATLSMGASVDSQTGNLSVFDILEEIRTPQLPVQIPFLVLSLIVKKEDPGSFEGKMLIHLMSPDGDQQIIGSGDIRMTPDQGRMKACFKFAGFPVAHFGSYRFVLSFVNAGGNKIGETILSFESIQVSQAGPVVAAETKPGLAH